MESLLLPVIVLADLPHSYQSFEVLVGLVGVDVVEGAAVSGIPVGGCEVDCHLGQKHTHAHRVSGHGTDNETLL